MSMSVNNKIADIIITLQIRAAPFWFTPLLSSPLPSTKNNCCHYSACSSRVFQNCIDLEEIGRFFFHKWFYTICFSLRVVGVSYSTVWKLVFTHPYPTGAVQVTVFFSLTQTMIKTNPLWQISGCLFLRWILISGITELVNWCLF